MIRAATLSLVAAFASAGAGWMAAQDEKSTGLDLPSVGLKSEHGEETPDVVRFYGVEFEGDAFFWCLDRSGSMGWNDKIGTLKRETVRAIRDLSDASQFAVVSFSTNTTTWRPRPQVARYANRAAAIEWVETLRANGFTCIGDAAIATLGISDSSSKRQKRLILLSDGAPSCGGEYTVEETLDRITAANSQRTPIDCVYISSDDAGIEFMQSLAARNQGDFYHVPLPPHCP